MTVQQAQAEINKCEQEITRAHSALCSAARTVGSSAKECADGSKTKKTLLPLIISVIGIFFYFGSAWFLGLVMIIAGIDKAYNMNQSAGSVVSKVEAAQKTLNSTIDNNSKI